MKILTTCQICGRDIKAKNGVIAHHGYKRPGQGWQTASCFGARFRPYEVACDAIPPAIENVSAYIQSTKLSLLNWIHNPPESITVQRKDCWGNRKGEPIVYMRPDNFDSKATNYHLNHTYEYEHNKRIRGMEQQIKFAKIDLDFLTERLAKWKAPE